MFENQSRLEEATAFLESFLSAGERDVRDIMATAEHAGITLRTLRRAMLALGVTPRKRWRVEDGRQGWAWALPEDGTRAERTVAALKSKGVIG